MQNTEKNAVVSVMPGNKNQSDRKSRSPRGTSSPKKPRTKEEGDQTPIPDVIDASSGEEDRDSDPVANFQKKLMAAMADQFDQFRTHFTSQLSETKKLQEECRRQLVEVSAKTDSSMDLAKVLLTIKLPGVIMAGHRWPDPCIRAASDAAAMSRHRRAIAVEAS